MKAVFALAVLAVIATVTDSSVLPSSGNDTNAEVVSRNNLNVGISGLGDRLLYSAEVRRFPIANIVQQQDESWRGTEGRRITSIRATEIGATQGARAQIWMGGVAFGWVTVRFTSAVGRGFHYRLLVYGH